MILSRWNGPTNEVYAVKCAKRGNDVYRSRVYRRFKNLCSKAENLTFFNPKDRGAKETSALWVTLTYDSKLCSFQDAWRNIGIEFNRFTAYVRKRFGKVSCCRVFESFESGYPHVHCILLFEVSFSVFIDSKGQFRIHEKSIIAEGWHSNVDVKAMSSLAGGFSYLKKYLLKGINFEKADSKALKTLALCWAYRKHTFSVSGSFRKLLADLIKDMHNSNLELRQITLSGEIIEEVEERFFVLGFVPAAEIGLNNKGWFSRLNSEQISNAEEYLNNRASNFCMHAWIDIDFANCSVRVTPEKGSNPRNLKISGKLISMLNELPKNSSKPFLAKQDAMRKSFQLQRKRIATKLQNPRLLQVKFHTFRHWKATMEYHKTKDILHVMQMLGHRNIQNTLIYTQLMNSKDEDYVAKVATSEKEICQLVESGFEYVCDYNGNKVFRKRK